MKPASISSSSSCCFTSNNHHNAAAYAPDRPASTVRDKCFHLFSRRRSSARGGGGRRRSNVNMSDFRYDPLSYALNFEDDVDESRLDEFPLRNFSARLPPSPPRRAEKFGPGTEKVLVPQARVWV